MRIRWRGLGRCSRDTVRRCLNLISNDTIPAGMIKKLNVREDFCYHLGLVEAVDDVLTGYIRLTCARKIGPNAQYSVRGIFAPAKWNMSTKETRLDAPIFCGTLEMLSEKDRAKFIDSKYDIGNLGFVNPYRRIKQIPLSEIKYSPEARNVLDTGLKNLPRVYADLLASLKEMTYSYQKLLVFPPAFRELAKEVGAIHLAKITSFTKKARIMKIRERGINSADFFSEDESTELEEVIASLWEEPREK